LIFYQVICVLSNDGCCVAVLTGIMLSNPNAHINPANKYSKLGLNCAM
jgi:hypothetical protein